MKQLYIALDMSTLAVADMSLDTIKEKLESAQNFHKVYQQIMGNDSMPDEIRSITHDVYSKYSSGMLIFFDELKKEEVNGERKEDISKLLTRFKEAELVSTQYQHLSSASIKSIDDDTIQADRERVKKFFTQASNNQMHKLKITQAYDSLAKHIEATKIDAKDIKEELGIYPTIFELFFELLRSIFVQHDTQKLIDIDKRGRGIIHSALQQKIEHYSAELTSLGNEGRQYLEQKIDRYKNLRDVVAASALSREKVISNEQLSLEKDELDTILQSDAKQVRQTLEQKKQAQVSELDIHARISDFLKMSEMYMSYLKQDKEKILSKTVELEKQPGSMSEKILASRRNSSILAQIP
ncbi:hypothetical protein [Candidatus Lariskella endosymbiont of Epinotia ramella]|uniref:hypothetical protein n=1 Tax=Candidatus Lariskella endosymbiont of Epinotia ramella TaxID=3066224 RepID=UPI0030CFD03E